MGDLGWPELIIILAVLLLLFGAKKLPDIARSTGRSLRIFKSEVKGLREDEDAAADAKAEGDSPKTGTSKDRPGSSGASQASTRTAEAPAEASAETDPARQHAPR